MERPACWQTGDAPVSVEIGKRQTGKVLVPVASERLPLTDSSVWSGTLLTPMPRRGLPLLLTPYKPERAQCGVRKVKRCAARSDAPLLAAPSYARGSIAPRCNG